VHATGEKILRQLAAQGAMIEGLCADSRRCGPGSAFLAYPGEAGDGRAHIGEALSRGAAAILWEAERFAWRDEWRVPNVAVAGLKHSAGAIAAEFFGRPSASLWVCGVTGTNGKTSCSQWLAACLGRVGTRAAVIGTLGAGFPGSLQAAANTTPDAVELQRELSQFLAQGAAAVAMEVSSHGLVQGRVGGVAFDCALFTNLSHDHLDYHGSMQAYAEAKTRLFDTPGLEAAVVNLDDDLGVKLAQRLSARGVRTIGYSISGITTDVREYITTVEDHLHTSWGRAALKVNALGRFNLANALGVLGCLLAYGIELEAAAKLLAELPPVPGRMEQLGDEPLVVVDYAHTPDALEKVLQALRPIAQARRGRLIAVFGAGGERDAAKRPLMGAVVARLADAAVVTSDNPRSEDPLAIIAQIVRGMPAAAPQEPDRAHAIEQALAAAAPRDVVLIAGKGHEPYQEVAGRRLPFSDIAVARAALARRSRA
jgi:UDP-N-acetylmuramoyl-L-alanyl-D-glutamate--2,6-diaminopimelate ligase